MNRSLTQRLLCGSLALLLGAALWLPLLHVFYTRPAEQFHGLTGLITALFLVAHLAGLREFTAFICGTSARPEWGWPFVALLGTAYLVLYFGCILAVPVLLLQDWRRGWRYGHVKFQPRVLVSDIDVVDMGPSSEETSTSA